LICFQFGKSIWHCRSVFHILQPVTICDQFPIYHNLSTSNSKDSVFNFLLFCWLLHICSILQIIRLDCDLFIGRRYGICKCNQADKHTLIYSMEMSAERLGDRVIIAKNRNESTGTVLFGYNESMTRIGGYGGK